MTKGTRVVAVIEYEGVVATLNSDGKWTADTEIAEQYLNSRFSPRDYSSAMADNFESAVKEAARVTKATIKKYDGGKSLASGGQERIH
jgi:hypothetical protein